MFRRYLHNFRSEYTVPNKEGREVQYKIRTNYIIFCIDFPSRSMSKAIPQNFGLEKYSVYQEPIAPMGGSLKTYRSVKLRMIRLESINHNHILILHFEKSMYLIAK